jgi:hypothetical protein
MKAMIKTDPLVWVKDETGHRILCPMDRLQNPIRVEKKEKRYCVDDDSRLAHPEAVPGEGKLRFGESRSLS